LERGRQYVAPATSTNQDLAPTIRRSLDQDRRLFRRTGEGGGDQAGRARADDNDSRT